MTTDAMQIEVCNFNEDDMHKDYELFVDNVAGFDWKFFFYLDKETGEWTDFTFAWSIPGDPYQECDAKEVPPEVLNLARVKRDEIIAKARGLR
jgi:hypothetical protein